MSGSIQACKLEPSILSNLHMHLAVIGQVFCHHGPGGPVLVKFSHPGHTPRHPDLLSYLFSSGLVEPLGYDWSRTISVASSMEDGMRYDRITPAKQMCRSRS